MKSNEPIDPRVRLAISRWPVVAPRGAVTAFCAEHDISRQTFYRVRARAREEGQAAALEPRSRRPRTSPARIEEGVKLQALEVRAALEASGWDHGPISVHDKMLRMGIEAPSVASLARIFRERGVARLETKKKPQAAWRRFVYPAPNACWQLDATEYVLTGGRTCVIFQLEDDHSRLALASHVAAGETSDDALAVAKKAVAAHGVPQRLLTDNGTALNPTRRGWIGQLVTYMSTLGVEAITGKPGKPTTQGKNERFHQTLFQFLDKQPLARTLEELQAQVDRFDTSYNTERGHQALPGRITPIQAWQATPVAQPPRPKPAPVEPVLPASPSAPQAGVPTPSGPRPASRGTKPTEPRGHRELTVGQNGTVALRGTRFMIAHRMIGQPIYAAWDPDGLILADQDGVVIAEHPWPPKGTTYVSNGLPRDPIPRRQPPSSPMS